MARDFVGIDVLSAMQGATGRKGSASDNRYRQCLKLRAELGDAESSLAGLERDIEAAARQIEHLKDDRRIALETASVSAITASLGGLGTAINLVKKLRGIARSGARGTNLGTELLTLVPVIGGLTMAILNLQRASNAHNRIRSTVRQIERLKNQAQGLDRKLRILGGHYDGYHCGALVG